MQAKLFETSIKVEGRSGLSTGFRVPAFAKNKELPVYRWVPWVAGCSANFVEDCLDAFLPLTKSREDIWILDPFAGVGTTLVEGYRHGFNVVGFEINPYAALASRIKLQARRISTAKLAEAINCFESFMNSKCPDGFAIRQVPISKPPEGFTGNTQLVTNAVSKPIPVALDSITAL